MAGANRTSRGTESEVEAAPASASGVRVRENRT